MIKTTQYNRVVKEMHGIKDSELFYYGDEVVYPLPYEDDDTMVWRYLCESLCGKHVVQNEKGLIQVWENIAKPKPKPAKRYRVKSCTNAMIELATHDYVFARDADAFRSPSYSFIFRYFYWEYCGGEVFNGTPGLYNGKEFWPDWLLEEIV